MKKPKNCPNCGSKSIAKILYGMPVYCEELQKKMDVGQITLWGCCEPIGGPVFECNDCRAKICEDGSFECEKDFEE